MSTHIPLSAEERAMIKTHAEQTRRTPEVLRLLADLEAVNARLAKYEESRANTLAIVSWHVGRTALFDKRIPPETVLGVFADLRNAIVRGLLQDEAPTQMEQDWIADLRARLAPQPDGAL